MWRYWTVSIFLWGSMAALTLCQSGDDDGGSGGFHVSIEATSAANNVSRAAAAGGGDAAPVRLTEKQKRMTPASTSAPTTTTPPPPPTLLYEPRPDRCSVNFDTNPASARRLKAQREEMAYLKAIQHGNQAVLENLVQYVGAELGDQSYADVIRENVVGIKEEHVSCHGTVEKVIEDLEQQLLGGDVVSEALGSLHKIREESRAFEGMLRAAADIAGRLESSSGSLHAAFTKKLKNTPTVHR